jgi:coiled-coil domain-containing protein 55
MNSEQPAQWGLQSKPSIQAGKSRTLRQRSPTPREKQTDDQSHALMRAVPSSPLNLTPWPQQHSRLTITTLTSLSPHSRSPNNLPALASRKQQQTTAKNYFDESDDSDSDGEGDSVETVNRQIQAQASRKVAAAVSAADEYDFDGEYTVQQNAREEDKRKAMEEAKKGRDKPKYIENLLATAQNRQREQEKRTERKAAKEVEESSAEFGDKEKFVTSGYKKKLLEREALEKKEKEDEDQEDEESRKRMKIGGMAGFHSGKVGMMEGKVEEEKPAVKKIVEEKSKTSRWGSTPASLSSSSSSSSSGFEKTASTQINEAVEAAKLKAEETARKNEERAERLKTRAAKVDAARARYIKRRDNLGPAK